MRTGNFRGFEVTLEDPGIAIITLNQPDRLNGTTQPMKRDLVETIAQAQMDEAVRVVMITGSGRAFCAGDDMSGRRPWGDAEALMPDIPPGHGDPIGTYEGLRWLSQSLNVALRSLDKLTIAAINGVAIQTGLSLALSCDFRIASKDARLGSGTLRFGLLPDEGGQFLLVQTIGLPKTLDFLMRSRIVGAEEALDVGLVHEVVEPAELMPRAMELAQQMAAKSPVALYYAKESTNRALHGDIGGNLVHEADLYSLMFSTDDAREGLRAFVEKRDPTFIGK